MGTHEQLDAIVTPRRGKAHGSSLARQEGAPIEWHRSRAGENQQAIAGPSAGMAAQFAEKPGRFCRSGKKSPSRFSANGRSTRRRPVGTGSQER